MPAPARAMGRDDLVEAIERKLDELRAHQRKLRWIGRFKYYDRKLLGGTIARTRQLLRRNRQRGVNHDGATTD